MSTRAVDLLQIFADDKRMILYRPEWRKITNSITAAILLQQIIFHWDRHERKPFYKFKEPCAHELYKQGDSWTEELGFSRAEFDNAIQKIGYKKSRKRNASHNLPVEYWIDPSRLTYYAVHEENLFRLLESLYQHTRPALPCQNGECPVKRESDVTKSEKVTLPKRESDVTKSDNPAIHIKQETDVRKINNPDFPSNDQRSSSEKKTTSESEQSSPALALFFEKFPNVYLSKRRKKDIIETVTNLDAWKFTIWWWDAKEYQAEYSENMLDYYLKKAIPRLTQTQEPPPRQESLFAATGGGNGNGHDPLWNAVLQGLRKRVNPASFNTWIRPIALLDRQAQTVRIGVPEEVFAYWLQEHYQSIITELLAAQLGFQPQLEFVVNAQQEKGYNA